MIRDRLCNMVSVIEIAKLLKRKEVTAFEWVYDRYASLLYGFILTLTPDPDLADEILRKSFIQIWLQADSYNASNCSLFTWLFSITVKECTQTLSISTQGLVEKYLLKKPAEQAFEIDYQEE